MSSKPRLSSTSFIVLALIEAAGEATPYELKQVVALTLGNFWSVPHAQVYAEPERLAAAGLLSERREQGGRHRRHYKLTEEGGKVLREWLDEPTEAMAELRDPGLLKLFFGGDPKALAAAQLSLHRRKLEEYEALDEQIQGHVSEGFGLALRAGIGHEREWVRFWELVERGEKP
jgi:DNA-binding PadR family transcriptional regulator